MKFPIPTAKSVTNAFGVNEVFQERLVNMYAERPAPMPNNEGGQDLMFSLRTVPGERYLIDPADFVDNSGRPLQCIGAFWMEHHNIPQFSNRLLVCTDVGVSMWALPRSRGSERPRYLKEVVGSFRPWEGTEGRVESDVHIASNGFSWLITHNSGFGYVYEPAPLLPVRGLLPHSAETRSIGLFGGETNPDATTANVLSLWQARMTRFLTVQEFRVGKSVPPAADGLTPTVLDEWWEGRNTREIDEDGNVVPVNTMGFDFPNALAEFEGGANFGAVIFHGGRYIAQERDSGRFYWSGVAGSFDQHIFLPLDRATAEADGDPIVSLITNRKLFYPLGTRTAETWYTNTPGTITAGAGGAVTLPFAHAPASDSDRGCAGEYAVAHIAETAFWLGRDGSVFGAGKGGEIRRVSNPAQAELVSTIPSAAAPGGRRDLSNARLFGWQDAGHDFLAVRVPGAPTIILDLTTAQWHQRGHQPDEESGPEWRVRGVVETGSRLGLVGWGRDGVYELLPGYDRFDGTSGEVEGREQDTIKRTFVLPLIENNRELVTLNEVEVLTQVSGRNTPIAPELFLRVSFDRGETQTRTVSTSLVAGKPSVFVGSLGQGSDILLTFNYDAPGSLTVFGVYADITTTPDETMA